jgi:hypothetical protein
MGRGGEGRARWGRREGPDRGGGCPTGWGRVPDGDFWGPDGMGGCLKGKDAGDHRGGCLNKGEG